MAQSSLTFISVNSAAAEEILTAPLEIPVSDLTRLPAETAVLSIRETTLPLWPAGLPESGASGSIPCSYARFTWAKICKWMKQSNMRIKQGIVVRSRC